MTSLDSLKKEVAILNKVLAVNDKPRQQETEKLLFYSQKLIELSRNPDAEALHALNLEIAAFNEAHPMTPDDLIKLQPYLNAF